MYNYIRATYARLNYFYPRSYLKNNLKVIIYLFKIFFWKFLVLFFKLLPKQKKYKYIFIAEDERYIQHYNNLKKNNLIPKKTFLIDKDYKFKKLIKFLFNSDYYFYRNIIFHIIKSGFVFKVYICELATPDSLYLVTILNLLGSKVIFVQHSEIIFNNYWKNYMPFVSQYYVRHYFMYKYLLNTYNISKNKIKVVNKLWKLNYSSLRKNKRIILIGQPLANLIQFLKGYFKDKSLLKKFIDEKIRNMICFSKDNNSNLVYLRHPRESFNNIPQIIKENFEIYNTDQITFYKSDYIFAYFSSLILELYILGFECQLLAPSYEGTIFSDKEFQILADKNYL